MSTRNRTQFFKDARERYHRGLGGRKRQFVGRPGNDRDIEMVELGRARLIDEEMGMGVSGTAPPPWLEAIDKIKYQISRVTRQVEELEEKQEQHLLPGFNDRVGEEHEIDIKTREITRLFHQLQGRVQGIYVSRSGHDNVTNDQEQIQKNIQSKLAGELHELTMRFRKGQQSYLQRLRKLEMAQDPFYGESRPSFHQQGMSEQDLAQIEDSEDVAQHREQELRNIASSVNDLAEVVKDIALLVVDQGQILDRIDYNIEMTDHQVDEAIESLRKTEQDSKKTRMKSCMMLLCVLILGSMLILFLKLAVKLIS